MYTIPEKMNNLTRNTTKVKNIQKEITGNNEKGLCCVTKSGK